MEDNNCRIIKISKDALFEFIYENFISQQESLLDLDSYVGISNHFDLNLETGEFIFLARNGEDSKGNILPFPKDIDLRKVMERLPDTTTTVLSSDVNYKDYSYDELRELIKE